VDGVLVTASNGGGTYTTGSDGYYELAVLSEWSGSVTPEKSGWLFTPSERTYETVSADQPDQNYTARVQPYGGGSGSEADPFLIGDVNQLQAMMGYPEDWDKHFLQIHDIDLVSLTSSDYSPIGTPANRFTGVFDGNGYRIINMGFNKSGTYIEHIALFGYVFFEGIIRNVTLIDVNVRVYGENGGTLVGSNYGNVENCGVVGGQFTGDGDNMGGLIGYNYNYVSECYSELAVSFTSSSYDNHGGLLGLNRKGTVENCWATVNLHGAYNASNVGGLIGQIREGSVLHCHTVGEIEGYCEVTGGLAGANDGLIQDCYSDVTVQVTGWMRGGLVGSNTGTIESSHATGDILTASSNFAGGLVGINGSMMGINTGIITNCYAIGNVFSETDLAGGLAGFNCYNSLIAYSYSLGDVTVSGTASRTGGFVGESQMARITDCYTMGNVSGDNRVGGFAGSVNGSSQEPGEDYFRRCYSTGTVTGNSGVGGLVGYRYWTGVEHSFWDMDSSGVSTSAAGTGKTTEEMQRRSTFTDAGWDFIGETANGTDDFWDICDGMNYPKLVWQVPVPGDFVCPDGVDLIDFSIFASAWLSTPGRVGWNSECDISDPPDEIIDLLDATVFFEHWLCGQ